MLPGVGYTMSDIRYFWRDGLSSVGMSSEVELPQFRVLGHRQRATEINLTTGTETKSFNNYSHNPQTHIHTHKQHSHRNEYSHQTQPDNTTPPRNTNPKLDTTHQTTENLYQPYKPSLYTNINPSKTLTHISRTPRQSQTFRHSFNQKATHKHTYSHIHTITNHPSRSQSQPSPLLRPKINPTTCNPILNKTIHHNHRHIHAKSAHIQHHAMQHVRLFVLCDGLV